MTPDSAENPYRAPQAAVAGAGIDRDVTYAGFWRRVLAWVIDQVALQFAIRAVSLALGAGLGSVPFAWSTDADVVARMALGSLLSLALVSTYFIVCWHELQGSLGHLAVGARVRDANEHPDLTWLQCAVRYAACAAAWLPFGLGFIWAAFDARKQGWHDKIASTVVVRV